MKPPGTRGITPDCPTDRRARPERGADDMSDKDARGSRQADAELRRTNELLEHVFSSVRVLIAYMDRDFNFLRVNQAYAEADDHSPGFYTGKNHFDLFPSPENEAIFRRVVETGEPYLTYGKPFEYAGHPERGVTYWDWRLQPVREADGTVTGLVLSLLDVTDRKRNEELIRQGHARLMDQQKALAALTKSQFFASHDTDSTIRHILEVIAVQIGVGRVSLWRFTEDREAIRCADLYETGIGRHTSGMELKTCDYPSYFKALKTEEAIVAGRALSHPATCEFADTYLIPLGISSMLDVPVHLYGRLEGVVCLERVGQPADWNPEQIFFAIATGNLVSLAIEQDERRKAEARLIESERFVKSILDAVDAGFIVIDPEYRIVSANNAYSTAVGMTPEQVRGRRCHEILHHSDRPCNETDHEAGFVCPARHTFITGEPCVTFHEHRSNGDTAYVEARTFPLRDASGKVASSIEILTDITDKRRLEEQLRHSQKLEAIGTLAGGVAHDFNNMLNIIVGYAGMMEMKMGKSDPMAHYLREILHAAERATHLTQGLLAFSRKQAMDLKPSDLNEIVRSVRKMILRIIGEDIEQKTELGKNPLTVMADWGQIEQVLINLATNARGAMPDGGVLMIQTGLEEIDSEFIERHGFGKPGRYACVTVHDNGSGMDEQTRERIFEPFFTTKEVGRGTGLGLAIVYGIIRQHKGYITCESEPGKGTSFRVYLPFAHYAAADEKEEGRTPPQRGTETVLLAEDDDTLRMLTRDILGSFGYNVIEAVDGEDAVGKFRDNRERIGLLLFDVIMPRKSGKEAYAEIQAIRPGIKAIFLSGYSADVVARKGMLEKDVNFIFKPVTPDTLLTKVREVLDCS